ncbi:hypothetical protein BKA14_000156 [Actinoplanes abujensis]|uniref:Uncharacterized protein n=1 Tax=Paractinoplanes abujensis TaxID=882441 RepID=A0A7W7FXJ5_9ACTN|nr:hypothetical protein [Actinoplanes abujensis]
MTVPAAASIAIAGAQVSDINVVAGKLIGSHT